MRPIRSILVPVDFDEPSTAAFALGLDLARTLGASVTLLHVFQEPPDLLRTDAVLDQDPTARLAKAARHAVEAVRDAHASSGVLVEAHAVPGNPAKEIVSWASSRGFDLVVMGTHGRRGAERLWLGSVAERVLRLTPCPVLTTHERKK